MTPEEVRRHVRGIADEDGSANDRFKESFSTWLAGGLILATLAHFALFELFPTMRAADIEVKSQRTEAVEIPPPPQQVARPATPKVSAAADVSEDVTISKTTFESNPTEQLPPPPKSTGEESEEGQPAFIPYDVAPELKNPGEVQQYLRNVYPPSLRENNIGGTVTLWVYVDEAGEVQKTRVRKSSSYDAFDRAARKVARRMQFSPAMNRDKKTAVWVQQRIHFQVK